MTTTQQNKGSDNPSPRTDWRAYGRAIVMGLGLVVASVVVGGLFSIPLIVLGGTGLAAAIALIVLSEVSYALVGWVYLRRWFSETVPFEVPTLQQFGWVIASTIVMLGIAGGIGVLSTSMGIQVGRVDQEFLAGSRTMVLAMAILSPIVVAPAEEYLFRGVIQRRLTRSMRPRAAIFVASLLFVLPHAVGYLGGIVGILLLSGAPFFLAVVTGVLYETYNNLTIPILVHGLYNATLFSITYVTAF